MFRFNSQNCIDSSVTFSMVSDMQSVLTVYPLMTVLVHSEMTLCHWKAAKIQFATNLKGSFSKEAC